MSTTHPLPTMPELDIRVAADAYEAAEAQHLGYEPVECSFGSVSIVGDLELDHHGSMADRPPVCAQTRWVLHHPAPTHYVVAGPPDADASLCIAILSSPALRETVACGEQYLRALRAAEEEDRIAATCPSVTAAQAAYGDREQLLDTLIGLVGSADCGRWEDLTREGHAGAVILAWHARQRHAGRRTMALPDRWVLAVYDWAALLGAAGDAPEVFAAIAAETERIRLAREAAITPYPAAHEGVPVTGSVDLVESSVMGADVWYADHPGMRGYVAWQSETVRISVSIRPGTAVGDGLLGIDDLIADGWGGRPEILGSPRGVTMTREQAVDVARMLATRISALTLDRQVADHA